MIRYVWTGEYGIVDYDKWYMEHHTLRPVQQKNASDTTERWILRRVETEEGEEK